jgi:hypothetical protein
MTILSAFKKLYIKYIGNRRKAHYIRNKYALNDKNYFSGDDNAYYKIAVAAIFKGEDQYLKEWIEFHRLVGVEHFFLYDNGDCESSRNILKPYIDEGIVTYIPFPEFPEKILRSSYGKENFSKLSMQNLAMGDCVINYSRYFNWLVKIDIDEFLYPLSPHESLSGVFDLLDKDNIKGMAFRASRFGPSGQVKSTPLPVIERFTKRYPDYDRNWKVAGKSSCINKRTGYHTCHKYFYKINPFKKELKDEVTSEYVHLNHYYIKSREEYLAKIEYHSAGHKAGKEKADKWPEADRKANFDDERIIFRFLDRLKERL